MSRSGIVLCISFCSVFLRPLGHHEMSRSHSVKESLLNPPHHETSVTVEIQMDHPTKHTRTCTQPSQHFIHEALSESHHGDNQHCLLQSSCFRSVKKDGLHFPAAPQSWSVGFEGQRCVIVES